MAAKKFYRFAYYSTPERKDRSPLLHQLRDGDAALEISDVLREHGYAYGGPLLNYPGDSSERRHADVSFLRRNDLILLNTRPPLDDVDDGDRRKVCPSHTDLEARIFATLRSSFFAVCSRSQVTLHPSLPLPPEGARYRSMRFTMYGGAYSRADGTVPGRPGKALRSHAFMLFKKHVWPDGPGLLCVFGMGGPESLIVNHLVRTRQNLRRLVCKFEFILIEMKENSIELPQDNLHFLSAPGWEADVALKLLPVR